jgi:hypothetical protein
MEKQNLNILSDTEFDLMDELYFVIQFNELKSKLNWDTVKLKTNLLTLIEKGWVRFMKNPDGIINPSFDQLKDNIENLYFLATKEGLLKHNSI